MEIHAYTKQELALLYFPTASTKAIAVRHLMAWIKRCTPLYSELIRCGYYPAQKNLTPRQVRLIVDHIGEP